MNIKDPRYDVPIWNCGCAALMCISFTALLAEACIVQMGGKPSLHYTCTLLVLAQATAIYHSIRPYRARAAHMLGGGGRGWRVNKADLAAALCLAALGYGGVAWLRTSWASGAALFAVLLGVFPWSRIPLCRDRLPVAAAMLLAGGAALLLTGKPVDTPFFLLVPAWLLWAGANCAWLTLILLKLRRSRALASYPASG